MANNQPLYSDPLAAIKSSMIESEAGLQNLKTVYVKPVFDLQAAVESSNVLVSEDITEPVKCLAVRNEAGTATIGTLGNISLLMGKAKGKKSFLVQLLVNAAINQGDPEAFIISSLPEGKRTVLVIDTEQGRYRSQKILKRAKRQVKAHNDNLLVYDLRSFTPGQRVEIAQQIIYTTPNLGLVLIDGARDLVTSINDEEQATNLSSLLLKWTADLQIHICVVLHQNKNDAQARGHLGTELVNKAETVLSATKDPADPSISIVQAEACRDKEFQPFAFCINEEGLPLIVNDYVHSELKTKVGGRAGWKPEDILHEEHIEVLSGIWSSLSVPFLKYGEFQEAIKMGFQERAVKISKSRAAQLTIYYKMAGLVVIQGKTPNTVYKYIKKEDIPVSIIEVEKIQSLLLL